MTIRPKRWFWLLDATAVILFAVVGRADHGFTSDLADYLRISAPFLMGLAISIAAVRAWRRPLRWLTGLGLAVGTTAVGLVLRNIVWGDGTARSFILVTTGFMIASMVGWRLMALAVTWVAARRTNQSPTVT